MMKKTLCMFSFLFFSFPIFLFSSCNGTTGSDTGGTIGVQEFEQKLNSASQPQLVDVRTPEEFSEGHLKGALNIDWNGSSFETEIAKLDKNKPVLVYCRSGRRSASASDKMKELGFKEVYNLDGGILDWKKSGKPVE